VMCTDDAAAMRRALALAAAGPRADPNPRVGAVVVDSAGYVVGEGLHRGAGTPHAEVVALSAAGERSRGATVYVTLEPCNHSGRTGPCVAALLAAGVTRVVYAQDDPNPVATGGGRALQDAGVEVRSGLLAEDAAALNPAWAFAVTSGRPRVVWKFAATLDGRSAAVDGTSQWITGAEARADVHLLRAGCGAIVVGTTTALRDDPSLTVRRPNGTLVGRQPLRVVMGRRPVPVGSRVRNGDAPTLLFPDRDPAALLQVLALRQVRQVWLEGGPTLAAAFLRAGLVDEVVAYLAPTLLGAGRSAVSDLGVQTLGAALRLHPTEVTTLGPDIRLRATLFPYSLEGT
jgi:diaminohydroxyphosphoribosylaminopyrimidine deaminase/5-amino-6-(5-phosphoribosylamino)uracil reductase